MAALAWVAVFGAASAHAAFIAPQDQSAGAESKVKAPKQEPKDKKELAKKLKEKTEQMSELRTKAEGVTLSMAELAKSGKVTVNDDTIELMKKMVQELQDINERLKRVEEDVEEVKGWIEGQNESLPVLTNDINELKRAKPTSYLQIQFRESEEPGGRESSAFAARRVRIGQSFSVDPKTSIKYSFDIATGSDTTSAQMRDAFVTYTPIPSEDKVGWELVAGQAPLPLGYELERSSSEREFPERAQYNRVMFDGERGRGIYTKYGLSSNAYVHLGVWDALTFNDPEQRGLAAGQYGKLAWTGGVRMYGTNWDFGVSGLSGKRPQYIDSNKNFSPSTDRRFLYLDGGYTGLIVPELSLRAEMMFGDDRVPNATANVNNVAHDMRGHQVQLTYNLNPRNQLSARLEQFDPNRDKDGDVFTGFGLAYSYFINPGAKLTLAIERFQNPSRPADYNVFTVRTQFKF